MLIYNELRSNLQYTTKLYAKFVVYPKVHTICCQSVILLTFTFNCVHVTVKNSLANPYLYSFIHNDLHLALLFWRNVLPEFYEMFLLMLKINQQVLSKSGLIQDSKESTYMLLVTGILLMHIHICKHHLWLERKIMGQSYYQNLFFRTPNLGPLRKDKKLKFATQRQ